MEQQTRSWSHLPDVCLLLVFKELSTSDMICSVGRVCTNWSRMQRVEMGHRNTLAIVTILPRDNDNVKTLEELRQYENPFGSELIEHVLRDDGTPWAKLPSLDKIEFNTLRVPSDVLTEAFTSLVMDTLPNITHLTLVMCVPFNLRISSLQQLIRLISHYTTSLVSLKLDFQSELPVNASRNNSDNLVPLFNSINRLESLRHLTLNITNLVHSYPELSILSRLTTFTSGVSYPARSLLSSLRQYAPNGNDLRVECGTDLPDSEMHLNELIKLDPQLATKFTRLNDVQVEFDQSPNDMRLFCQRFVSLHSLGLTTGHIGMPTTKLAQYLSQLPELVNLKLIFCYIPEDEVEDGLVQPEFTPVPTVRMLSIDMTTRSHHDTECLHLHQIFLNLQVLHLRQETEACDECHFNYKDYDFETELELLTRFAHCMHLSRQPFRQCANLHTVKLDTWDSDEGNLSRLLPQGLITRDQL